MLIRKNTKAFKTILEIITECRDRPDREQLIRLYITKAGDSVRDRINIEGIQGEAKLFYEMNYQAVLGNLTSANHQLHESDEIPGIYFFHSTSNKVWDETPFEFDEAIKKEYASLPELPTLRKKEKTEKFIFPAPQMRAQSTRDKVDPKKQKTANKKEPAEKKKVAKVVDLWPKQPDYKLKHDIHFTGLERIAFRQEQLTKKDVLDYYDKISKHLLPYLKDRPLMIRVHRDGQPVTISADATSLAKNSAEEIPEWIHTVTTGKGKEQQQFLVCNDREHLLFYVQIGCLEFKTGLSRLAAKSLAPDYLVLGIESPDYELTRAVKAALAAKEILMRLQLPSFVKADGGSGLHIYIPLDSKSGFEASNRVAEYLCKLVQLKVRDLVSLKGPNDNVYTKVALNYLVNEKDQYVIAPFSLVAPSANVATPLLWDEVREGLTADAFNHDTIFKRLKKEGDPFESLLRKKVNADALLEKMEEHYSFLF